MRNTHAMIRLRSALLCIAVCSALPARASAQGPEVRGFVRDSASGEPVPGVVVMMVDARGQVVNRTISGARGQYRVLRPVSSVQLRAIRLGFRPRTLTLPQPLVESAEINVSMATVARTLDAVDVVAARGCPARTDRAEAFGLLDQARAGLLATVVARERQIADMRVLRYERWFDVDGVSIERQAVQIDSTLRAPTSFNAVQSAVDFVDRGFRSGRDGRFTYFGPDADILLDERFQRGYCFSVAESQPDRSTQRGLRFSPAGRQRGRVDIEGTLWIDTAQRVLRDVEFLYVGVDRIAASFGTGGRIRFHSLSNGVTFIDQWSLRLVGAADTVETDVGLSSQEYAIREVGGEVAAARWADSTTFLATLATAHITAVRSDGEPAAFTRLRLAGTDYHTDTDSLGRGAIPYVLPGPYRLVVKDPQFDAIDLEIPIARAVQIQRASAALLRVVAPTAREYVAPLCGRDTILDNRAWILARVLGSDGEPLGGLQYKIADRRDSDWRVVSERGVTPSSGVVALCRAVTPGAEIEVSAWKRTSETVRVRGRLDGPLTVVRVVVPTARTVAQGALSAAPIVASGTVLDTVRRVPVPNARITFLGSPLEAATDDSGRFVIGGIPRGVHRVEISTPWYDSIGAVGRTTVTIRDSTPLTLALPALADILRAACGTTTADVGAVVGRVRLRNGESVPPGVRVLAEWDTLAGRSNVAADSMVPRTPSGADAVVDANGNFRVCGAPVGASLRLRSISDARVMLKDVERETRIDETRRFARADLELDSVSLSLPVLVGSVIVDSTGAPIVNADVSLTDLGRTVRTDSRGAFRVDDVPVGTHVLSVRQVGYAPSFATLDFQAGRVVEQRVSLARATRLSAIETNADGAPLEFETRRKLGAGTFLSRAELDQHRGRRLGEVLGQVTGFGQAAGGGARSFVVGKRAPVRLPPRKGPAGCGQGGINPNCTFSVNDLRDQGFYCPTQAEQRQGILSCACFAQVYVDNLLMNSGRPTEPFDVSTIAVDEVAGVEFFPTPASTPSRYSNLNAVCGVMLVWTRRS
ncbi:MAG: carboxypeptidase regulatory-like domain-containing protein [Gemmatimonadaceae bacterium]|nr:carboxypeptidase regulatory-like domain-containing protein [Gemmatimonadaceae bacterium]